MHHKGRTRFVAKSARTRVPLFDPVCSLPPDCSLKVKDVLREFDADGDLAQHRHGEVRERRVLLRPTPGKLTHTAMWSARRSTEQKIAANQESDSCVLWSN